jgi:hypothetical protein
VWFPIQHADFFMNQPEQLRDLFRRYLDGILTREELNDFLGLLDDPENKEGIYILMDEVWREATQKGLSGPDAAQVSYPEQDAGMNRLLPVPPASAGCTRDSDRQAGHNKGIDARAWGGQAPPCSCPGPDVTASFRMAISAQSIHRDTGQEAGYRPMIYGSLPSKIGYLHRGNLFLNPNNQNYVFQRDFQMAKQGQPSMPPTSHVYANIGWSYCKMAVRHAFSYVYARFRRRS